MLLHSFDPRTHSQDDLQNAREFANCPEAHPSDEFAESVLSAAHCAAACRHRQQFEIGKPDLAAETESLMKSLGVASVGLRSMSATLARRLEIEADPIELANSIDYLATFLGRAAAKAPAASRAMKPAEADRAVAMVLAREVLPVLSDYGIGPGATVDAANGRASLPIQILKAIGDDMGLRLSQTTWRNIIQDSKKVAKAPRWPGR